MGDGGIRRRFELYADMQSDIRYQSMRLYTKQRSAQAPSSPSFEEHRTGKGGVSDRVGSAAAELDELRETIRQLEARAAAERTELERLMQPLGSGQKNVLRAIYMDRLEWTDVEGFIGKCRKTCEKYRDEAFRLMEDFYGKETE
jgi:hypothetical protein